MSQFLHDDDGQRRREGYSNTSGFSPKTADLTRVQHVGVTTRLGLFDFY